MNLHREIHFEEPICKYLGAQGWMYTEGDAEHYDRARALFPADVLAWARETQPQAWEALAKSHGTAAETTLLDRLRKQMDERGTLDVIRHGIELLGLRRPLALAQSKPALAMNADLQARYAANRLRVVRQVRYSLHNENAIDLVLFLNGIPVATVELKSDFTQSVDDAVDQYRFDRNPKPKGQGNSEPLLDFPRGALVHFAVSQSQVRMTTRLEGAKTNFLPFNLGDHGGAGNPVREGFRTAYLWEQVWQRDSWLEILGRYLVTPRDSKKQIKALIFPRYHQLDVTRKLVTSIRADASQKFLIQHSAGSGKTNSIAWTAHFLADLHDAEQRKVFDTVLVVSDRNVLDAQLQEAIFDFERTTGVAAVIRGESGSKSADLAEALAGNKKIVVCTIQTFPFALKTVQELAATQGKRFAVIADEAHSSQTGEVASKLRQVLSVEEQQELADGGEVSSEDIVVAAQMSARADARGITYIAFTATPKAKTMELFGTPPNPALPASESNKPAPFHVYSMRQAIEEAFILDVLRNYTPYKVAFKLATDGKTFSDAEIERNAALKHLMRWVRLHPHNIAQKVQIVVEHFRENVAPLLDGHAKAMVVTGSRVEAVRWQIAIEKYIKNCGYKIGTLVAFSGEVNDSESGAEPLTEHSKKLNPNLRGRDMRQAFGTHEYQILLVANKFQTGFDQPLLCGMYVDRRLAGIQAVQTLSRLNRAYRGPLGVKDTTYILDFVNDPQDILAAFKTYYETAELSGITDPNLVYDLRAKLDATGYYDQREVERVVAAELRENAAQAELLAAIEPVADRLLRQFKAARERLRAAVESKDGSGENTAREEMDALHLFKGNLGVFLRVYSFLGQIFNYGNTDIEKRAIFFRRLLPLLEFGREREGVDLSQVVLTHHRLRNLGKQSLTLPGGEYPKLEPMMGIGSGRIRDPLRERLDEIIAHMNDLFGGDATENDKLVYVNHVKGKLLESELLAQQAANNSKEQFASSPDLGKALTNAIIDAFAAHSELSRQALDSETVRRGLRDIPLGPAQLYEALKEIRGASHD